MAKTRILLSESRLTASLPKSSALSEPASLTASLSKSAALTTTGSLLPEAASLLAPLATTALTSPLSLPLKRRTTSAKAAKRTGLLRQRLAGLALSKHLGRTTLKQVLLSRELPVHCRPVDRTVGIHRQETKPFPRNRIGIRAPQVSDAIGVEKRIDIGGEDPETALVLLNRTYIFLPTEYQFLLELSLGLHLVGGRGCSQRYRQRCQKNNQRGKRKSSVASRAVSMVHVVIRH